MTRLRACLAFAVCGLCTAQLKDSSTPWRFRLPQGAERERILDAAFHRDRPQNDTGIEIVVEINPSAHPEARIDVVARPGAAVVAHYARAAVGLQQAALQVAAQGDASEAGVVRAMRVTETSFNVERRQLDRLLLEFWESVAGSTKALSRRSLDGRVQLDGTEYRLHVRSERADVTLTLLDEEVGTPDHEGRLPIVGWISNLLRDCNAELTSAQESRN